MNNIIRIFLNDLKTISRNLIAFIVIIGISALPALYAWFNIAANWDPYGATSGIAFAVCSKDKGFAYKTLNINAGDKIIDSLKANDKMGWIFVDETTAVNGVKDGTYYAAVVIPENFSENLCSVTTGNFRKAELEYYVNEKKNAIAPKITDKGISTIATEVKSTYVSTITSVVASALNLTADELSGNKEKVVSDIDTSLKDIISGIDTLNASVDTFSSTTETLENLIKTNQILLPSVSETLSRSAQLTPNIKNSIETTRQASQKISDMLGEMMGSLSTMQKNVGSSVNDALSRLDTNTASAANTLVSAAESCQQMISVGNALTNILQNFGTNFGINSFSTVGLLKNAALRQQNIIDLLYNAADMISSTGSLPKNMQDNLKQTISLANAELASLGQTFAPLKSSLNTTIDSVYSVLDSASGLLQMINGDIPELDETLDNTQDTLTSMKTTFANLKKLLSNAKTQTQSLMDKVDDLGGDTELKDLVMNIVQEPESLGEFMAEPVATNTHSIHAVKNYGSGMAPFYTSLSFWVGGTILIAILRTEPTKKQLRLLNNPTHVQQYFGRYLIFFLVGQIQAFITSLGDIFFLQVQYDNPFLFVAASLISSFVYTLFIYSLTIAFNVVGKALVIITLVIQIAGAGGTFPVEVLPKPFRAVSPYLPFHYSIDALREAVTEPDIASFLQCILQLLAFVPVALFIGLVLRKPCMKIIEFLEKRIHQTELVV